MRSLGFGFGLEPLANFWRVSVSVLENLVSEKSLGFSRGKFGLGKKNRYRLEFWSRHSVVGALLYLLLEEITLNISWSRQFEVCRNKR